MKFKTLKDFQDKGDCGDCEEGVLCCCMELKHEAIKWVKEIQKAMEESERLDTEENKCSGEVIIGGLEFSWAYPDFEDFSSAIKILKYTYNITEEDLN